MTNAPERFGPPAGSYANAGRISSRGEWAVQPGGRSSALGERAGSSARPWRTRVSAATTMSASDHRDVADMRPPGQPQAENLLIVIFRDVRTPCDQNLRRYPSPRPSTLGCQYCASWYPCTSRSIRFRLFALDSG